MKKQSSHNRHMLSKNSILLLVMLVCIFLSTWAWFASGSMDASATGLSASTQTPATLQMALPDANGNAPENDEAYSSSINFDKIINLERIMESDVTSDGLYFIVPKTNQVDGVRTVLADQGWDKAIPNEDYISIPFYVRSEDQNIFVSGSSKLEATLKDGNNNIVNKSDAGEFSRNAIVGAMRVSILNVTQSLDGKTYSANYNPDEPDLRMTWIPRPDLQLNTPKSDKWTLDENVQRTTDPNTGAVTTSSYIHQYYMINDSNKYSLYYSSKKGNSIVSTPNTNAVYSVLTQDFVTPTLGRDVQIGNGKLTSDTSMTKTDFGNKKYYLYRFVMNIWIEGEDAEARRALNNGEFKLDIRFKAGTDNS